MVTFKNIILSTDLSENAQAAAPFAVELARASGGTIHLLHVVEDVFYYSSMGIEGVMAQDPALLLAEISETRTAQLREAAASLPVTEHVRVIPVLKQGQAANEIVKYAREIKADCIVIATHGRTGFSHFIFGSVAEKVVRHSCCPVLSVRPQKIVPIQKREAVGAGVGQRDEVVL